MIKFILTIFIIFLLGLFSIPYAIVCLFINDKDKICELNYKIIRNVIRFVLIVDGVRVHCDTLDIIKNIDISEPIFLISNHRGYFDILSVYSIMDRKCSIVAKSDLFKVPILGYWMKMINCLSLDRDNLRSGVKMIIDAINLIERGISVWIFPEGTRNKNLDPKELLEFKSGAFKIPLKTNCYVVPIAILNSESVFEKQFPRVKSSDIYIKFAKPYRISELSDAEKIDIGEYNRNIVKSLLIELMNKKEQICQNKM